MNDPASAQLISEIDWESWEPVDRATLLFIMQDGQILLIRKKRGLGAGKINGPGGRIEKGETILEAAVREVEEEVCVTPTGIREAGLLRFQFRDGYSIQAHVFTATDYTGTPASTDEADPLWFPLERIPYEEMWADDILWIPLMLANTPFTGNFIFDGDGMLDHQLT